jgi:site-specific DNA recombinase
MSLTQYGEPRAVAYIRVSMARQGMISPELQMAAISEHCKRRQYRVIEVLEDLDLSGRFWQNRQVDTAISMLENDAADVIVVWRWSRVARNRLDWAVAVDRVERAGGRLESATEPFDVSTSTGRFARGVLAEFAAFESERMGDVWREVRERRARLGLPVGGQRQFGYRKVDGQYVVDRRTGAKLVDIYRRYNAGESFRSLARWLNARGQLPAKPGVGKPTWSHKTVSDVMDRGFAAGHIIANGEFLPGAHKPLITEAEWQAYQRRRDATRWHARTDHARFLLDGFLTCQCGTAMTCEHGIAKNKYRCRSHGTANRQSTASSDRVDQLVIEWVGALATEPLWGDRAREESRTWAESQWRLARELATQLSAAGLETREAINNQIAVAEARSATIDPVRIAQGVLADWPVLTNGQRRSRLRLLVRDFVLEHTATTTLVMEVRTAWNSSMRFWGSVRPSVRSAPFGTTEPAMLASTEALAAEEAQWLSRALCRGVPGDD